MTREEDTWDSEHEDEWYYDSYDDNRELDRLYEAWAEQSEPKLRTDWVGKCERCDRYHVIDESHWVLCGKLMTKVCTCDHDGLGTSNPTCSTIYEVTDPVERDAMLATLLVGGPEALE